MLYSYILLCSNYRTVAYAAISPMKAYSLQKFSRSFHFAKLLFLPRYFSASSSEIQINHTSSNSLSSGSLYTNEFAPTTFSSLLIGCSQSLLSSPSNGTCIGYNSVCAFPMSPLSGYCSSFHQTDALLRASVPYIIYSTALSFRESPYSTSSLLTSPTYNQSMFLKCSCPVIVKQFLL